MKNILSPSILAADFTRLGEEIKTVCDAGAEYVHVDVMDGRFVQSISFGMPVIKSIRKSTGAVFDVHLMIEEPIRYIREFVESGADIITVHVEACSDVEATIDAIHAHNVKAGVAINPETEVGEILPYVGKADMLLVMSVHPGFGGQKFIPEVLDKVRTLKEYCTSNGIERDIEIDGGINLDNIFEVLEAGVNVVVAGSSVYRNDRTANVRAFLDAMRR
jgi:ribulose-phosphate 3-epimerase